MAGKISFYHKNFWIIFISIISLVCLINYFGYSYYKESTLQKEFSHILNIKDKIIDKVSNYFDEQIDHITQLLIKEKDIEIIAKNINAQVPCKYSLFIEANGNVALSSNTKISKNTNFFKTYKNSSLAQILHQSSIILDPAISDFELFLDEPTIFLVFPFISNHTYLGSFAVALIADDLSAIVANNFSQVDDILIARKINEKVVLLFGTKRDPHAAFHKTFPLRSEYLISRAIAGDLGTEIVTINGKEYLNTRTYLVNTNWAMVILQDLSKALTWAYVFYYSLLFLCLLLMSAIGMALFFSRKKIEEWILKKHEIIFFYMPIVFFIVLTFVCGVLIKNYGYSKDAIHKQQLVKINEEVQYINAKILDMLYTVENFARETIFKFNSGELNNTNFDPYATKSLDNSKTILGILLDDTLYVRKDNEVKKIKPSEDSALFKAIKNKSTENWLEPVVVKEASDQLVLLYNKPFDNRNLTIIYSYQSLLDAISYLEQKKQKNTIIFNPLGNLIFYKDTKFIVDKINFDEIIRPINSALKTVKERGTKGYAGQLNFENKKNKHNEWAIYTSIPGPAWTMLVFVEDNDFYSSTDTLYHLSIWLVITIVFIILCGLAYMIKVHLVSYKKNQVFGILNAIVFFLGLFFIIFNYYQFSSRAAYSNAIVDKLKLNKIIEDDIEYNQAIPIKTGIKINFLQADDISNISFIARVWQVFDTTEHANIERGITIRNITQELESKEIARRVEDGKEFIEWEISGKIYLLNNNSSKSPFDIQHVDFALQSKDLFHNVILELDIDKYSELDPFSKPAIGTTINKVSNFTIDSSLFYYENLDLDKDTSNNLVFRINLRRKILSFFISFIIPIFVILLSIFVLYVHFWFAGDANIPIYVALFFSLILLQQSYRTSLHTTVTTYLDYIIFIVYLILTASFLDNFLSKRAQELRIILYWPLFFLAMFITTIILFYNV